MSTIVTRAGKGSALTWTEGDANITNLNNDKMEKSAPVLAGNLDVATYSIITSTTNGNIVIEPNGTGDVHLVTDALRVGDLNTEARISTYGTGNLVLTTNEGNDPDPSITIGNGANANITITPTGTGSIILDGQYWPQADGTADQVLKTNGSGQLSWTTVSGGGSSSLSGLSDISFGSLTTSDVLQYNGSAWTDVAPSTLTVGVASTVSITNDDTTNATNYPLFANATSGNLSPRADTNFTFNPSTGTLTTTYFSGGLIGHVGAVTPLTGSFTTLTFKNPIEAAYSLGTTGGTIAPNVANGSVQKITLNSALTLNAFTSPTAGQSLTLIITGGTAYTSITSTMLFAGGVKTLTGTAGCIDIVSIYYDGTNYYASINKGFA